MGVAVDFERSSLSLLALRPPQPLKPSFLSINSFILSIWPKLPLQLSKRDFKIRLAPLVSRRMGSPRGRACLPPRPSGNRSRYAVLSSPLFEIRSELITSCALVLLQLFAISKEWKLGEVCANFQVVDVSLLLLLSWMPGLRRSNSLVASPLGTEHVCSYPSACLPRPLPLLRKGLDHFSTFLCPSPSTRPVTVPGILPPTI